MPYQYAPVYVPGTVQYAPQVPQPAGQLEQLRAAQAFQAQAAQPANPGIIWVQGEAGAKAYMVAPGASVMLMDAEGQSFYIKGADASGMPLPLRIFDYAERIQQPQPAPAQAQEIQAEPAEPPATKAELEELRSQIEELRKSISNEGRRERNGNGKESAVRTT